ncbi:ECF transporter S component [Cellulomonas oligotrophica]|uniref:Energy-coupling factor transport system substrate-specific component n=1 Tax=Cellulomonas oligotrophica TaxID=931536 RepID=A0A7Y9FDX4_9CELL|nr:ECF transporter S component [Cellulomonas oligotrophica]NYD85363.1 energy-coupling factor transport system substrate-specific component [Cellulomonas oligotrophica]GIG33202.1 hypothetical protein Col01nite_23610 [Cellulomonas oligotrophica]
MSGFSTRLLLSCAAIGVAGGILGIPNYHLFTALSVAAPFLMGLAAGLYVLPGVVAQAAFRRPGVGFLTTMLAGVVSAPFTPTGFASVYGWLWIAVIMELPYAVTLYRYWKAPVAYALAVGAAGLYTWMWWTYYDMGTYAAWAQALLPSLLLVGLVGSTWLGRLVAARLAATGALRGLRLPEDRRRRAAGAAGDAARTDPAVPESPVADAPAPTPTA